MLLQTDRFHREARRVLRGEPHTTRAEQERAITAAIAKRERRKARNLALMTRAWLRGLAPDYPGEPVVILAKPPNAEGLAALRHALSINNTSEILTD